MSHTVQLGVVKVELKGSHNLMRYTVTFIIII